MALKMDKVNKKNKADEELKKLEQSTEIKSSTTEIITALNAPKEEIKTQPVIINEDKAKTVEKKEATKQAIKKADEIKKKVGRPKTKNEEYKRIAVDLSPEIYEMALAINSISENNMTLCISNLIKEKYLKNEELYKQIMAVKNKLK